MPDRLYPIKPTSGEMIPMHIENKQEYTKRLIGLLRPHFYTQFNDMYQDARKTDNSLSNFQKKLEEISNWSSTNRARFCNKIIKEEDCNWLNDLIAAVLVSTSTIMICGSNIDTSVTIKVPSDKTFCHECLKQTARELWQNPTLYTSSNNTVESEHNVKSILAIITSSIKDTITKLLPLKELINVYLIPDMSLSRVNNSLSQNMHAESEKINSKQNKNNKSEENSELSRQQEKSNPKQDNNNKVKDSSVTNPESDVDNEKTKAQDESTPKTDNTPPNKQVTEKEEEPNKGIPLAVPPKPSVLNDSTTNQEETESKNERSNPTANTKDNSEVSSDGESQTNLLSVKANTEVNNKDNNSSTSEDNNPLDLSSKTQPQLTSSQEPTKPTNDEEQNIKRVNVNLNNNPSSAEEDSIISDLAKDLKNYNQSNNNKNQSDVPSSSKSSNKELPKLKVGNDSDSNSSSSINFENISVGGNTGVNSLMKSGGGGIDIEKDLLSTDSSN